MLEGDGSVDPKVMSLTRNQRFIVGIYKRATELGYAGRPWEAIVSHFNVKDLPFYSNLSPEVFTQKQWVTLVQRKLQLYLRAVPLYGGSSLSSSMGPYIRPFVFHYITTWKLAITGGWMYIDWWFSFWHKFSFQLSSTTDGRPDFLVACRPLLVGVYNHITPSRFSSRLLY